MLKGKVAKRRRGSELNQGFGVMIIAGTILGGVLTAGWLGFQDWRMRVANKRYDDFLNRKLEQQKLDKE